MSLIWSRARRCDTNTCVEMAADLEEPVVLMRDSKNPEGDIVSFPVDQWNEFVQEVVSGKHQISAWEKLPAS